MTQTERRERRVLRAMTDADLIAGCARGAGWWSGGERYAGWYVASGQCLAELLDRVGPAGAQARADETRYFESVAATHDHKRGRRDITRAVSFARPHYDARGRLDGLVVSYVTTDSRTDYVPRYDPTHAHCWSLRVEAYLVVRDATSGERHVLRIPPRFGATRSATVRNAIVTEYYDRETRTWREPQYWSLAIRGGTAGCPACRGAGRHTYLTARARRRCLPCAGTGRLPVRQRDTLYDQAAAWTFGLRADEYRPDIAA